MPSVRYIGKVCERHPQLMGERRNGNCPSCMRERARDPEYRKRQRATPAHRRKVRKWREANWECFSEAKVARNAALRAKSKEIALSPNRHWGRACRKHPELKGERYLQSKNCVGCAREHQSERSRTPEYRARKSARAKTLEARASRRDQYHCDKERIRDRRLTDEFRAKKREYHCRPETRDRLRDYRAANVAARNALKRNAVVGDAQQINRAYAALLRTAKRLGMTIDHVVPIAGCRVCGKRGMHVQSNWQLLMGSQNSSKGNRCQACWEGDKLPKSLSNERCTQC